MRNEWATDLDIIDHLELLNSTTEAAKWLEISQSSCSRRYRIFSDQCGLEFSREGNQYKANKNLDVLADLRKAAQGIRVRQGRMRIIRGWQLGQKKIESMNSLGKELPIRPMNTMQILNILEARLADIAVMGILECKDLIPTSFDNLRLGRVPIGPRMMCIPICKWNLNIVARSDHPLTETRDVAKEDLGSYPSLALPMGTAPVLMAELNQHNLGSHPSNHVNYSEDEWEGYANQGVGLSYSAPFLLAELGRQRGLKEVNYELDITECLSIVGHRDVILDPCFGSLLKTIFAEIMAIMAGNTKKVKWLH
jgi:hypothetical protein